MEADKAPWDLGAPIYEEKWTFLSEARRFKKFSKGNNEQLSIMTQAQNQYILRSMEVWKSSEVYNKYKSSVKHQI